MSNTHSTMANTNRFNSINYNSNSNTNDFKHNKSISKSNFFSKLMTKKDKTYKGMKRLFGITIKENNNNGFHSFIKRMN